MNDNADDTNDANELSEDSGEECEGPSGAEVKILRKELRKVRKETAESLRCLMNISSESVQNLNALKHNFEAQARQEAAGSRTAAANAPHASARRPSYLSNPKRAKRPAFEIRLVSGGYLNIAHSFERSAIILNKADISVLLSVVYHVGARSLAQPEPD